MRASNTLVLLSFLIAVLAAVATASGLFWPGDGATIPFTTPRGETVTLFGQEPYRYDSLLIGAGFRGADAIALFLAVPLLVYSTFRYWRGSLRGAFLLMGALAYFLYNYASMAFGAAYNNLYLVYVALFSASLFAFVLSFTAIEVDRLPAHIASDMPHRAIAVFMFVTGLIFLIVWLGVGILPALSRGEPPGELGNYTTLVTHALDLGILMPVSVLAGFLLLRRAPLGYLLAFNVLILGIFVVGLSVPAATVSQLLAGYQFEVAQIVAFVVPFVVLGLLALWLAATFLRNVEE